MNIRLVQWPAPPRAENQTLWPSVATVMKLSCAETASPWNRKDSVWIQRSLGMDLSKLLCFRVFVTPWGHPPQESLALWLGSPSALITPCLLPAAHPSSTGPVWSYRATMKLLPVAPLLLLLLTTLEARPKPAGEPWLVGSAWREEKREHRAVEPSEDTLLCDVGGHDASSLGASSGGWRIPPLVGHKLPGPSMVVLVLLALGTS